MADRNPIIDAALAKAYSYDNGDDDLDLTPAYSTADIVRGVDPMAGVGSRLGTKWTSPAQDAAARQRFLDAEHKPTLIGKTLGALGIDASGERAATPWLDAFISSLHMPSRFLQAGKQALTAPSRAITNDVSYYDTAIPQRDEKGNEYISDMGPITPGTAIAEGLNFAGTIASSSPVASATGAVPANTAGMFAGRLGAENLAKRGETRPLQAIELADRLKAEGADRATIYAETNKILEGTPYAGVSYPKDGKPRFEIDDRGAKFYRDPGRTSDASAKLRYWKVDDAFDHPELYKAYPDAGDPVFTIQGKPGGYYYDPSMENVQRALNGEPLKRPAIVVSNSEFATASPKSITLHELQHPIQGEEGWARGAALDTFTQQKEAELARDALVWRREMDRHQGDLSHRDNLVAEEYKKLGASDWIPSNEARNLAMDTAGNPTSELEKIRDFYGLDQKTSPYTPRQMYDRTLGEVEARAVQKRMDLTPEERRARAPWEDYDVPESQQIVRGVSSNPEESAGDFAKSLNVRPMDKRRLHDIGAANFDTPYRIDPVESVPLSSLSGSAFNPEKVGPLSDAIRSNGWIEPLVVDRNGNVIEGQHRLRALRELGAETVPVHRLREVVPADAAKAITEAARGAGVRREHASQIADQIAQIIDKEGVKALGDYEPPQGFEKAWDAAVAAASNAKLYSNPEESAGVGAAVRAAAEDPRSFAIDQGLKHLEEYRRKATKGETDDGFSYRVVQGKDVPGYDDVIADATAKALDLTDRARLERAYDQGYDLIVPGVHGSRTEPFNQFDINAPRANDSGFYGRGHYFVNRDPNKVGPGYGHLNEGYGEASYYGKNVAPYFLRRENPLDLGSYDYTKSELGKVGDWGGKLDTLGLATPELKETMEAAKRFDDVMKSAEVRKFSDGTMQAVAKHPDHDYEIAGVANTHRGEKEFTTEKEALDSLRNALYRQLQENSYWDRKTQTYKPQKPWPIDWDRTPSLEKYVMREMPWDRSGQEILDGSGRLTKAAKEAGHDQIIYGDETAKFDNTGIRHFDAVFDPSKADSANVLASNPDNAAGVGSLIRSASEDAVQKALDVAGRKPIRAYHGAKQPYDGDTYNPRKSQYKAFFAAEDPAYASSFARSYGDAPRVYPVDISPNAKLFDYANPEHTKRLADAVEKNPGILANSYLVGPKTIRDWIERGDAGILEDAGVQRWLRKNGYDGWKFEDTAGLGDNRTSYGILKPGHVRSATTGDILYSNSGNASLPGTILRNSEDPVTKALRVARSVPGDATKPPLVRGYHATSAPEFSKFDTEMMGSRGKTDEGAFFWSKGHDLVNAYADPDYTINDALMREIIQKNTTPEGKLKMDAINKEFNDNKVMVGSPRIIPGDIDTSNFGKVNLTGYDWQRDEGARLKKAIDKAKADGKDGLIIDGMKDGTGIVDTQYAVWGQNTVTSPMSGEQLFARTDMVELPALQRPFSADYPTRPGFPGTKLATTIDGTIIRPDAEVVGRQTVGGPDVPLSHQAQLNVLNRMGVPVRHADPELALTGPHYYMPPGYPHIADEHIGLNLKDNQLPNALPHEMAHAIDNKISKGAWTKPSKDVLDELSAVYSWQNGSKTGDVTPETFGYTKEQSTKELVAEGLRAYMQAPGTFKDVAPKAAKMFRDLINRDPELSNIVQFNSNPKESAAVGSAARAAADRSIEDALRVVRNIDPLGYYSQALEAARGLRQAKGTPEQMLAQLKSAGVKDAEIEATGLRGFLDGKKSVTQDEIVGHLEGNRVGLNESVYPRLDPEAVSTLKRIFPDMSDAELARNARQQPTKWNKFSLDPSNPTYRETVLHLPEPAKISREDYIKRYREGNPDTRQTDDDIAHGWAVGQLLPGERLRQNFQSFHFDEPNIVGHLMTSMTKHEGKPVYTIDQIQSDWGQKFRDGRVRDEAKIAELKARHAEAKAAADLAYEAADEWVSSELEMPPVGRYSDEDSRMLIRERLMSAEGGTERYHKVKAAEEPQKLLWAEIRTAEAATPGHPLVNTTDQWTQTTLRRALRQAAEADAEYIAIPHGDTVLSYSPGDEAGMRGFYGSRTSEGIVPKNLRKMLEKIDKSIKPVKVEKLETSHGLEGWQGQHKEHATGRRLVDDRQMHNESRIDRSQTGFTLFPLTPKIKKAIMEDGQALFSNSKESAAAGSAARAAASTKSDVDATISRAIKASADEGAVEDALKVAKDTKKGRPVLFYRGHNPESSERISTGDKKWDSHLFVSSELDSARMYGREITAYRAKPDAKILYEGTKDFRTVAGQWRKNENMLQYASRAASEAKQAGYDAVWFKRQGDLGTAIINRDAFEVVPTAGANASESIDNALRTASKYLD